MRVHHGGWNAGDAGMAVEGRGFYGDGDQGCRSPLHQCLHCVDLADSGCVVVRVRDQPHGLYHDPDCVLVEMGDGLHGLRHDPDGVVVRMGDGLHGLHHDPNYAAVRMRDGLRGLYHDPDCVAVRMRDGLHGLHHDHAEQHVDVQIDVHEERGTGW